jgi:hypothetical protein
VAFRPGNAIQAKYKSYYKCYAQYPVWLKTFYIQRFGKAHNLYLTFFKQKHFYKDDFSTV